MGSKILEWWIYGLMEVLNVLIYVDGFLLLKFDKRLIMAKIIFHLITCGNTKKGKKVCGIIFSFVK